MLKNPATAHEREILRRDRLTETYAELAIRLSLLALFLYWSIILVRPFLSVIVWSIVICVALYPIYEWLAARLGGRRRIAAALTSAFALTVVIGPASWLVFTLIETLRLVVERSDAALLLPHPPESVKGWPVFGEWLFQFWDLAATNMRAALLTIAPHLRPMGNFFLVFMADAGIGMLKFFVSIIIAGLLFVPGPALVLSLKSFVRRVASAHAEQFVKLAGASIRTVAQGVIGIAALQALLAGIGLLIAGIPAPSLFTTLVLIFGIMQIGPALVLIPLIIWGWMTMDTPVALAFTAYMAVVSVLDNILKPIVMKRGLNTPVPVIIIGVVGGTLSYGITGLFLGPIVLAVIWELAVEWIYALEAKQSSA
jgi:predicted PurR-regulated permease PerM